MYIFIRINCNSKTRNKTKEKERKRRHNAAVYYTVSQKIKTHMALPITLFPKINQLLSKLADSVENLQQTRI